MVFIAQDPNAGGNTSFLGKLVGGIVKVGGDILTGHLGNIPGDIKSTISGGGSSVQPMILPPIQQAGVFSSTPFGLNTFAQSGFFGPSGQAGIDVPQSFPGSVPTPGIGGTISRILPGGMSGYSGAPPGYHVNKRYAQYYRANQLGHHVADPTKKSQVVNVVVRNRKMNPLNPRALRRANARQHAAVRLMRAAMKGTGWHITRHGFGAKKTRRR